MVVSVTMLALLLARGGEGTPSHVTRGRVRGTHIPFVRRSRAITQRGGRGGRGTSEVRAEMQSLNELPPQ
eukprot:1371563-Amorphochlora_amoeboformis.AAC.1